MKSTYGTMYYVDDMKKSVEFYKKTIGATATYESDAWTEFNLSGHNLCLHSKRAGEKYDTNGVMIINAEGIQTLFNQMKNDGLNVFGLHEVHPGAWTFHMKDLSSNELSFYGKP